MKFQRKLIIVSMVLMLAGLAGLLPYAYFWNRNRIASANAPVLMVPERAPLPVKPEVITGKPSRILIPSLSMDLAIVDGVYSQNTKTWTLSSDKAHYALPSVQPNDDKGNTLIYGHYRPEVFARLHTIKVGAEIQVLTDNGYRFIYSYRETKAVDPTNVDIFAYEGKPQLTIQTCSGAWMQNRQFYFSDFVRVEKI